MKKLHPQKMSLYRKIGWFLNKKRGRNDLFLITAPLTEGSCNHKVMIELDRLKKSIRLTTSIFPKNQQSNWISELVFL